MSAAPREGNIDAYFRDACGWDADRIAGAQRSERNAWRVAGAGCVCALAASLALVFLLPLKRVEPYVIRVDNSTGAVDVVPVYAGRASMQEIVTRYFLAHYIQVCERFNFSTAESDYEECGAFNGAQRNQAWYALWNQNNPASPLNVHKDGSAVSVQIASVSFFKRGNGVADLAQVRYVKIEHQSGGAAPRTSHWIATIEYAYVAPAVNPNMRRWNPLGFKVIDLVAEQEVVHESPISPSLSPPAAGGVGTGK